MSFEEFFHILLHSLKDSALVLPFLFLTYVLIEIIQRKATFINNGKFLTGKLSPLYGSALGIFPQCGFSVMSAKLYENGLIKGGTLLAVFIATSDEAFALLLTNGEFLPLLTLLVLKFVLAIIVGFTVNSFIKKGLVIRYKGSYSMSHEEYCRQCGNSQNAKTKTEAFIWFPLLHALKTFAFVIAVNFVLGLLLHLIGEDKILSFMETERLLQPIVCALIGLIPNCASSILITQLYIKGGIVFGSMFAGLSANAGIGLAIILKTKKKLKSSLLLIGILYVISCLSGLLINVIV